MKGYKIFDKGSFFFGKVYAENIVSDEDCVEVCSGGLYFCKKPSECFLGHDVIDDEGNVSDFAEVVALDETYTGDGVNFSTKKLQIGNKLDIIKFINASVFITRMGHRSPFFKVDEEYSNTSSYCDNTRVLVLSDFVKFTSRDCNTEVSSIGRFSYFNLSGNGCLVGSSGYSDTILLGGVRSIVGSAGMYATINSSGMENRIISSGWGSTILSSGCDTRINSTGVNTKILTSGDCSVVNSSGDAVQISSIGHSVTINSTGKKAVINCFGRNCIVKAKIGSCITFAERDLYVLGATKYVDVKTVFVDGVLIKEDTYYRLENNKLVEVERL